MTREELLALKIKPINKKIEKEVKAIWDGIAKPLDGLGEFELLLARMSPRISLAKRIRRFSSPAWRILDKD